VRVRHRVGQLQEQRQLPGHRQARRRHVDRAAMHLLHHEKGQAVGRQAGVVQARDVRVVQPGQRLPLGGEAAQYRGAALAMPQQLDGGPPVEGAIDAPRLVHIAHAAPAEQANQLPGTAALAFAGRLRVGQERLRNRRMGQQRGHLAPHLGGLAGRRHEAGPLGFGPFERGVEEAPHRGPVGRRCGGSGVAWHGSRI
jgi:hypothetical protein